MVKDDNESRNRYFSSVKSSQVWQIIRQTYLAQRSTVIRKAVPSGRGSSIAHWLSWPLRLPIMRALVRKIFECWDLRSRGPSSFFLQIKTTLFSSLTRKFLYVGYRQLPRCYPEIRNDNADCFVKIKICLKITFIHFSQLILLYVIKTTTTKKLSKEYNMRLNSLNIDDKSH